MRDNSKLVAIAYDLNFKHAAEIFSGVSEYVQNHGLDWQLLPLSFGFEEKLMGLASSGRLSGAIGTFVSDEWIRGLTFRDVAAVNLFNFSKIESVPTIRLNDAGIGSMAAQHLLEQGARSLSFIGQDEAYFNLIRREAFAEKCKPGIFHKIDSMGSRRHQAESLLQMEPPVGVLCSSDRIARELCNEATLLNIDPGNRLLVIGIGNDAAESTFAGIGLSSFEIPARAIGTLAAEAMQHVLTHGQPEAMLEHNKTAEARLIARESTLSSPQALLMERATAIINESIAIADFDIALLCMRLGVSRRTLELTTSELQKKSPYQILSEKRLEKAKTMLIETNRKITEIGEACGYPEPHHFSAWFKQRAMVAPRTYRTQNQ